MNIEEFKELKECEKYLCDAYGGAVHIGVDVFKRLIAAFVELADAEIARKSVTDEEVQVQGWIPVSEYKGYGIYVPVLQRSEDGEYYEEFAYYDNQRKSWAKQDNSGEDFLLDNVTHYFNLPEPPKGEQP